MNHTKEPDIWKISHGPKDIPTDLRNTFKERNVIVVHGSTNAKGSSKVSQGEDFTKTIQKGDYFYLCYGNQGIQLLGEIIGDAVLNPERQDGWYEREYRIIKESVKTERYIGEQKWWAPSENSTCIRVKKEDYSLFEKELLMPYFQMKIHDLIPSYDSKGQKKDEKMERFTKMLLESKNIILRGAPGTGKTYLAHKIAENIVRLGQTENDSDLSEAIRNQIEFVQFHPSYDYSDFVEGLRPVLYEDGNMGFELKDGIFKIFIDRARRNYENSQKSKETFDKEISVQKTLYDFFSQIELGVDKFETINKREFSITDVTDTHIILHIPSNANPRLTLNINELRKMLESGQEFEMIKDITAFFGKTFATQGYSYDFALYKEIKKRKVQQNTPVQKQEEQKKYIFIIDEINRGEISKIFGELFFSIDPGYRGKNGSIATQYSNLHDDTNEKFYIPENVYIIGTMNDIDRSVDTFDFAMRRRFRFVEIKAEDQIEMLDVLESVGKKEEAIKRMHSLNKEIAKTEGLNENYQIGAAYFLKLKTVDYDQLWTDYLEPLLQEYVRGTGNEDEEMLKFADAYGYQSLKKESMDESTPD